MSNANVMSAANRLKHSLRSLMDRWEETKGSWNDGVRRSFEEQQLAPIERAVGVTVKAMQEIGEVLGKVRRDCSDQGESW